jgi:hypothetical protein
MEMAAVASVKNGKKLQTVHGFDFRHALSVAFKSAKLKSSEFQSWVCFGNVYYAWLSVQSSRLMRTPSCVGKLSTPR